MDIEHATDAEFDAWVKEQRIPVVNGQWGRNWSFDDRCGVINHVRKFGVKLKFLERNNSVNNSETIQLPNCLDSDKSALQEDGG